MVLVWILYAEEETLQVFIIVTVEDARESTKRGVSKNHREKVGEPAEEGGRNLGKEVRKKWRH